MPDPSTGGRLVAPAGRTLPLRGAALTADAAGGLARVTLQQRFHNPHPEPLAVTYSLPLPADGAVSGFSFIIDGHRVTGLVEGRQEARERYEEALLEGRSAALLEQDRSSLFTQEVGNIPPGAEVVVEIVIDQRLRWLDEGAWEWRFPTAAAPRYLGEPGRVPDAERIAQEVAEGPLPARVSLALVVRDRLVEGRTPESPSHSVRSAEAEGSRLVELAYGAAPLDRDMVVRWVVATPRVGASLAMCRPDAGDRRRGSAYGLLTVVPPAVGSAYRPVWRDVIVLLDTSGSMSGAPLAQAARVVSAIVDTLGDDDQIDLIEFGDAPRAWRPRPMRATAAMRREAVAWACSRKASGGTEMRTAISAALAGLREGAQRQVVLVTDGLIGFESQVVREICERLPESSRLHTVGVGSGVNRSLTGPAARAGRGVEVVIGLGEDPERAAARIVARTDAPLLVDLTVEGSALVEHAPARLPDLFAHSPALIGVSLRLAGGDLVVRGRTQEGWWEQRLFVPPLGEGEGNQAIAALFGRELVEDREMWRAAGGDAGEIDRAIEELGIAFQISTRLTSWVAVSSEQTVDPRDPLRRQRMPQQLPFGVSAEGLGLRRVGSPPQTRGVFVPGPSVSPRRRTFFDPQVDYRGGGGGYGGGSGGYGGGGATRGGRPVQGRGQGVPNHLQGRKEGPGARGGLGGKPARASSHEERELPPAAPAKPREEKKKAQKPFKLPPPPRPEIPAPIDDGVRRLRGRIALHRGLDLVIEAFADGRELDWVPPAVVKMFLADGRIVEVAVDSAKTTRASALSPSSLARLALALPEPIVAGSIRRIVVVQGSLEIMLGAR